MNDLTKISIISTAETALKKLAKGGIAVFDFKKSGAKCLFSVNGKDVEKVFAIFENSCYNIKVIRGGWKIRLKNAFLLRAGLVAGAVLFAVSALVANSYIFKIEVSGSGSYLEYEVKRIIYDEGAGEGSRFSSLNVSEATGRILALPQVTFCSIQKWGSILKVDVQTGDEHYDNVLKTPLISDCNGVVRNIVAICGTSAVSAGSEVSKGDTLIYACDAEGRECLAAGYAEIECSGSAEYFAPCESEENLKEAYSSVLIEEENVLSRKSSVKPTSDGVVYVISFTYLHRISINLE